MKHNLTIQILFILLVLSIFSSCSTKERYREIYGEPIYKVTLLDNFGNPIETKLAHQKYESVDWGMYQNYEFRYYEFIYSKNSQKWGVTYIRSWEWNKGNVKIELIKK